MSTNRSISKFTLLGDLAAWKVGAHADVRALVTDASVSKDLRNGPPGLAGDEVLDMNHADPPDHTRLRRLVSHAFTARRVAALEPRIQQLTDELIDRFAGSGRAELISEFAAPLPVTVISELMGVPPAQRATLRRLSTALFAGGSAASAHGDLLAFIDDLVAAKEDGDDLLTALVHAGEDGDRLTSAEVRSTAFLLLVAGHETTVNLIGNGVLALLEHPEQAELLRRDPALWPGAVEEILRFDAPVRHGTFRVATAPLGFADDEIPAGEIVVADYAAANHDPAVFPEPSRFDVTRAASAHLAFGHGIHYCLGAPLARLEGRIALGTLLRRLPDLRLAVPAAQLRRRADGIMAGVEELPVVFGP